MVETFAQSLGLVAEGDIVSLSVGLRVHGLILVDQATNVRHSLAVEARRPMEMLQHPILLEKWLRQPAVRALGRGPALGLLLSLNDIAGLNVKRTWYSTLRLLPRQFRLISRGLAVMRAARRFMASWQGLAYMIFEAAVPIICNIVAVTFLAYGANIPLADFIQIQLFFLLSLLTSTALHEAVHWRIARQGVFVRRGLRIGLLHPPLLPMHEKASALVGPVAGMLVALLFWACLAVLSTSTFGHFSMLLVVVFHACSWLPWYGDGQAVWQRKEHHA